MDECEELVRNSSSLSETCWFRIFVFIVLIASCLDLASVRLERFRDPTGVAITFTDSGTPFDPLKQKDPDVSLTAEERRIGGLGIYMVKKTMDDVKYEYRDGQNHLTIIKQF